MVKKLDAFKFDGVAESDNIVCEERGSSLDVERATLLFSFVRENFGFLIGICFLGFV